MPKLMLLKDNSLLSSQWIESFESAIISKNVQQIRILLYMFPTLLTKVEMNHILLLSMDAEALLCDMRQELIDQKTAITTKFSL